MKSIEANRRAFYRQLKKVVEKADVILVVLDARDPLVCALSSPSHLSPSILSLSPAL